LQILFLLLNQAKMRFISECFRIFKRKIVKMELLTSSKDLYLDYRNQMRQIADIKNAMAVLQWDEETYLPPKGAAFRGQQIATLTACAHQQFTALPFGELLRELVYREDLSEEEKRNVALSWEDYSKQRKLSSPFIRLKSETVSRCFHAWIEARKENSFRLFEKDLESLILLKKQEADMLGYVSHPYDALLDEYEKGCTVSMLDAIFGQIFQPLKKILDRIMRAKQVDDSFLYGFYPKKAQWDFGIHLIGQLGFDFDAGRQDISEHPFTTSFNKNDVRITTRIDENNFGKMLWSCIHETGHALYEQGLPESEYGLPLGEFTSLSIHESQSRLWENNIGRQHGFWKYHYPALQKVFPSQLNKTDLLAFYKGINRVQPSFIRTEADELTYHFHIMVRYELEKLLMEGSIKVREIPAFWNAHYAKYLGLEVPDDKNGCLQDVHWSHGSFGYFPTYSIGSLYAAQFYSAANKANPGLEKSIENGDTSSLLNWLHLHIHRFGKKFNSEDLCMQACGEKLNYQYFLDAILDKYTKIYNL
jgi:carboxypeptidase Taq